MKGGNKYKMRNKTYYIELGYSPDINDTEEVKFYDSISKEFTEIFIDKRGCYMVTGNDKIELKILVDKMNSFYKKFYNKEGYYEVQEFEDDD